MVNESYQIPGGWVRKAWGYKALPWGPGEEMAACLGRKINEN